MTIKISVIISSYNHEKFIAKAIESVLNQSFKDLELIITDDNSTDRTAEIINKYQDSRLIFSKNTQNFGMVINTNNSIKKARGEYIAILNSDDFWEPNKLQKQIDFMQQNPNCDLCFTLANMVDDDDKIINNPKSNPFEFQNFSPSQMANYLFFHNNFLCYPSVLMKKSIFNKINFFNPAYLILLDTDLWLRCSLAGLEIKIINEKLTNFRILNNQQNLSGKTPQKTIRYALENTKILNNFLKIKNYSEFIEIFPDYENIALGNKNLSTEFYLIDYCLKKIFTLNQKKFGNIKNFIIELIHDKSASNPDFFAVLCAELNLDYKKYSALINQYPNGNNVFKLKNKIRLHKILLLIFLSVILSTILLVLKLS